MKRVFITGYGFLSCLGDKKEEIYDNMKNGITKSGKIKKFEIGSIRTQEAFELPDDIDYFKYIPPKLFRRMDNPQKYLIYSTKMAMENALMDDEQARKPSIFVGTSFGGTDWTEKFFLNILSKGPKFANPQYFPPSVPNAAAGQLSIILNNTEKNQTFCHKEVSSELALNTGLCEMRHKGSQSCFIAGFEELGKFIILAFEKMGVLVRDKKGFAPLISYNGFLMGEGSGTVVLETEDSIRERQAKPIAEILSFNIRSSCSKQYDYPDDINFYKLIMEEAISKAGINYDDLSMIVSCANSTKLDHYEKEAISALDKKYNAFVPVFAPKGYIGEFYGSGIIRLILSLISMEYNTLFPHPWIREKKSYGINIYRPFFQEMDIKNVMINSFSNGGIGVSYIIRKL